jgi:hypothetical protein
MNSCVRVRACTHIDVGHLEAFVLQHGLYGDDVRMHLTPRKRLDGGIDDIGTVVTYLEDAGHRETGAAVSVILYKNVRMLGLDALGQGTEHSGLTDTCHILQTDFLCTCSNQLVGNLRVVFYGMNRAGGDTQGSLRNLAGLLRPLNAGDNITCIVQSAEDTGNVNALSLLYFVHQRTNIVGHRVHTQGVQTTIKHVCLDAHLVERLAESTYSVVRIFTCHEVYLLKCTAVGFHTGKAAHIDNGWGNTLQLVLTRLELTA